jgi:hypothetical protein
MPAKENRLRRAVLETLYRHFKAMPMVAMDLGDLADELGAPRAELRWNAAYLSLAGFVSLCSLHAGSGQGVELTAQGIDLVEDPRALRARLPLRSARRAKS